MKYLKLYEKFITNQDKNVQIIEDYFVSVLDMGFSGGTNEIDDVTRPYFVYDERFDTYQLLYQSKDTMPSSLSELKKIIDSVVEELESCGRRISSKCEKFSFYTYICERDDWDSDFFYKGSVFKNGIGNSIDTSSRPSLIGTLKNNKNTSYSIFIRLFIDKYKSR